MANNFVTTAGDGTGKTFLSFQSAGGIDLPAGAVVFATDITSGASNWYTPLAAVLADNTANPTTILHGACGMVYDGTNWDRMRGTSADGVLVDLGTNNDVTLATLPDTAGGALAAMVVDLAAIEVVLGTIDADTSTLAAIDFATGADVASLGVTGGGLEATALRVTLASDSTGVLSVDDGGGSLTVDGTPCPDQTVPWFGDGATHAVNVVMG